MTAYYWAYTRTAQVGGVRRPVGHLRCFLRLLDRFDPWCGAAAPKPSKELIP